MVTKVFKYLISYNTFIFYAICLLNTGFQKKNVHGFFFLRSNMFMVLIIVYASD